jgi:murein DD-endopeptidase MepM/ murein hydrolase activator NlpD
VVRNFPNGRRSWARLGASLALTASLLAAAATTPALSVASDDHSALHHRKSRVEHSIHTQQTAVDQVSQQLLRTQSRLTAARGSLQSARDELAGVRAQVATAIETDQLLQARLDAAILALRNARDDLARGRGDVAAKRAVLASYAVSNYQAGGSVSLGIAFDAQSAQEALNGVLATTTVLDKQSTALQRFQATTVLLKLTAQRVHETQLEVQRRRMSAAANLQRKRELEAQAEAAKRTVATRVSTLHNLRSDMTAAKRTEQHRLSVLQNERDRIDKRLQVIADRRARRHARELAKAKAKAKAPKAAPASLPDGGYLSYPVRNTYITSPYGMRMHPILHIMELHDGTDFHADCGTPVYAAADGRVMSEYFNVGYGNRLLIDHGFVHGVSLSTSYNHLSSYVAGVGEQVNRGELIAYSGTTGWSTACHLHFMVYVNGSTVDPVTWL